MLEVVLVDRARARAEAANRILEEWEGPFPLPADKEAAREQQLRALVIFLDCCIDTPNSSRALVWVHGEGFERIASLAAAISHPDLRIDAVFENADDLERVAVFLDQEDTQRVRLFVGHPTDFTEDGVYHWICLGWGDALDTGMARWVLRAMKRTSPGDAVKGRVHLATTLDREGQWARLARVIGEGLAFLLPPSPLGTRNEHRDAYLALARLVLQETPALPNLRSAVSEAHLCAFSRIAPFASLLLFVVHRGAMQPKKFDQLLELAQATYLLDAHRSSTHVLGDLVSYLEAL